MLNRAGTTFRKLPESEREGLDAVRAAALMAANPSCIKRPVLEYPSVGSCGALIEAGLGITALPVLALSLLNMTTLAAVPLQRPVVSRQIGIVTRIGRSLSPAGKAFMESLKHPDSCPNA